LLYYYTRDGVTRLYALDNCVNNILYIAYDDRYYFGPAYMAKELKGFAFPKLNRRLRIYVSYCPKCNLLRTDRKAILG
ncbi:hypothetical protein QBC32DRAFT_224927, partial [Pseudoneurospora amorphoporcata]